ncbi:MAG: pilus assembly protein PilM, partial [Sedimentisphaerales bacterium]|nr:pilus assembly protein PilM [Sedimentisphaerales bacterium]
MFWRRWQSGDYGPIGIDLGRAQVKLIQLEGPGGRVFRSRCEAIPRPDYAEDQACLADLLGRMARKGGFKGNKVVCGLGAGDLRITSVRVPDCPPDQVPERVFREVAGLGLDLGQYQLGFIQAGQVHQHGQSRQEVIILAASKEAIDAKVRTLDRAGLEVVGLEPSPLAMVRAAYRLAGCDGGPIAIVDVGLASTTIVLAHAGHVRLIKSIPAGIQTFIARIGQRLGIDLQEAGRLYERWQ